MNQLVVSDVEVLGTSVKKQKTGENGTDSDYLFSTFFHKQTIGFALFQDFVIPFLSLHDMVSAAASCRLINSLCRMYTIGEILKLKSIDISRHHKMELGKLVLSSIDLRYTSDIVHHRLVRSENEEPFKARLYHPSQLKEIELTMAAYFKMHGIASNLDFENSFDWRTNNHDSNVPVLVSAQFGVAGKTIDVTVMLRFLLMKQGNMKLVLMRPKKGFRYWYICLFGDPCPKVRKSLWIRCRSASGEILLKRFIEDSYVEMDLRAERISPLN